MGEKLKTLRTEMGLTQTQVANRVGVVVSAVSAYESGMRYPSYKVLIKLAALYHVSTDFLLGVSNTRSIDVSGLSEEDIAVLQKLSDTIRNKGWGYIEKLFLSLFKLAKRYLRIQFSLSLIFSILIFTIRENIIGTLSVKAGDTIGEYGRKIKDA